MTDTGVQVSLAGAQCGAWTLTARRTALNHTRLGLENGSVSVLKVS